MKTTTPTLSTKTISDDSPETIITAYGPKLPRATRQIHFPENELPHGRTKQSFKDEADINLIMERYARTGILEFQQRRQAQYGDFTGYDYQAAKDLVAKGYSMFYELPAIVRDRFKNDPAAFLDFVANDSNRAEAEKLGLLKPQEASSATEAGGAGGWHTPHAGSRGSGFQGGGWRQASRLDPLPLDVMGLGDTKSGILRP